jgi:hypothetical protein
MSDTWYVKVNSEGVVVGIYCDDMKQPEPGDIQLDKRFYWGQKDGIIITDPVHGERYTVKDGRLVPRFDMSREIEAMKGRKRQEIEMHPLSPLLSQKRRDRIPQAKEEVETHMAECINTEEVKHTLFIGY